MRPLSVLSRWIAAFAVVLLVAGLSFRHYFPPLPNPLTLDVTLGAEHTPGRSEPLITSGRTGAGDFLFIAYQADNAIAIGYEAWGEPSKLSAPIPLPPDRRLRLTVAMPGLSQVRGLFAPITHQLRVTIGETELFNQPVKHHLRLPSEIWFAGNPIGGTACDARFAGTIRLPDGRELRGSPTPLLSFRERLRAWLSVSRWQPVAAVLLGVVTYFIWPRLPWPAFRSVAQSLRRGPRALAADATLTCLGRGLWAHRWFAGTAAVCTLWFAWMVSYGTLDLLEAETFGDFYDHQATSLLHGRLDVPTDAIGGEAFVFEGRTYGYFGLTPALLRLPFVIYDLRFGELGRAFMTAYFALALLASYGILRTVYQVSGRGDGPPPAWATVGLIGSVGAGSTLFYLGSRAYIYHEAILCGVMLALVGGWAALRHYGEPHRRWWLVSLVAGVLSVNARPPAGFFALTLLGAMALAVWLKQRRTSPPLARRQILLGALCGVGVFTFNLTSYLKFRTFEGCPLRYNVQYDAARLARIDGKQFHLVNVPIAIDYYLVRPNFRLEAGFPYFLIGSSTPGRPWLETKIDYHDNTLGFPYAMPGLVWLAVIGGAVAFARFPRHRLPLAACWGAGLPMSLAMFAAIAITHRYTADFCPFLIVSAAWGIAGLDALSRPWRGHARYTTLGATVAAVLITAAITLHHQGKEVWGVPDEVRAKYADLRRGIDTVVGALSR
jgi:hypothetical protein